MNNSENVDPFAKGGGEPALLVARTTPMWHRPRPFTLAMGTATSRSPTRLSAATVCASVCLLLLVPINQSGRERRTCTGIPSTFRRLVLWQTRLRLTGLSARDAIPSQLQA
jgi:hypothetical protein